ncbi:hypothetical protein [Thermaurantiacus sp.]
MAEGSLAVAVVRRLAHDLASPLAALSLALELDGRPDPVAGQALQALVDRLDLWRALVGRAGEGVPDAPRLWALIEAEAGRAPGIALEGGLEGLGEPDARAAAALALLGLWLLPGRGKIRIVGRAVVLSGPVSAPDGLDRALTSGRTEEPALVPAALAALAAGPIRRMVDAGETRLAWGPEGDTAR